MGRKIAAIALSLGCLHTGSVLALGLGELELESFLNEPLKAQVDLLNTGTLHADEIKVRLATREDFEKMGLDRAYFLTGIKFEVVVDEGGGPKIVVSSDDPVLEPYLDFIIEARWPSGRLLREYTVLVDPPVFDQANPVISATQRVEEVEGIPAPVKKTDDPAVSEKSGTQVKVRESTLGPGEMPERDFSAETSPTPVSGRRYMIHRDDTLWEIAQQARPTDTSVHQTMLDIQRLNPNAFIDGNINRIKAGYIVYLPSQEDISSENLAAALAEVKQQNEDWRAGRASAPVASSGPTLRISAEEADPSGTEAGDDGAMPERDNASSGSDVEEQAELAALDGAESDSRLAAMEQQVETLSRIVTLKDEQIAALQAALAEVQASEGASSADLDSSPGDDSVVVDAGDTGEDAGLIEEDTGDSMAALDDSAEMAESVAESVPDEAEQSQVVAPVEAEAEAEPSAPPAEEGGMMSYLLYIVGAALIAIFGFIFLRRRNQDEAPAVEARSAAPAEDVFADVKLKEQPLEVEAPPLQDPEPVPPLEPEPEPADAEADSDSGSRGYGERKHDEYASDVDTGDALAEADIYIAYGRYPQAIDLLNNALVNDPGNAGYRLKLLELYAETDNADAAGAQLEELKTIGNASAIDRGQAVLADIGKADDPGDAARFIEPEVDAGAPVETPPVDFADAGDAPLQSDFSGLEIEDAASEDAAPEELDLSEDFARSELAQNDDEDLVIAAESNGLSTKLDLARAYLDMGDEDGARQILEEVVAEGSDELKAEAGALLDRIG